MFIEVVDPSDKAILDKKIEELAARKKVVCDKKRLTLVKTDKLEILRTRGPSRYFLRWLESPRDRKRLTPSEGFDRRKAMEEIQKERRKWR